MKVQQVKILLLCRVEKFESKGQLECHHYNFYAKCPRSLNPLYIVSDHIENGSEPLEYTVFL